jgi:hypothetical protein
MLNQAQKYILFFSFNKFWWNRKMCNLYDKMGIGNYHEFASCSQNSKSIKKKGIPQISVQEQVDGWTFQFSGRKKHTFRKVFILISCASLISHIQATKFIIPRCLPSISNQEVGQTLNNPITNRDASRNICKRADAHSIKHVYIEFQNLISAVHSLRKLSSHISKLGTNPIHASKYNWGSR